LKIGRVRPFSPTRVFINQKTHHRNCQFWVFRTPSQRVSKAYCKKLAKIQSVFYLPVSISRIATVEPHDRVVRHRSQLEGYGKDSHLNIHSVWIPPKTGKPWLICGYIVVRGKKKKLMWMWKTEPHMQPFHPTDTTALVPSCLLLPHTLHLLPVFHLSLPGPRVYPLPAHTSRHRLEGGCRLPVAGHDDGRTGSMRTYTSLLLRMPPPPSGLN
jgi:hypothetical protein